jgi:type IV secretory pathway ATPase VirB11/archaellum biosynthesis ATPase
MYNDSMFTNVDFGKLTKYLEDDDITDISYSNNGQLWLKSLSQGIYRVENNDINNAMV